MRVGLVQMNSQEDREHNLQVALRLIDQAAAQGADLVVLPEYVTYLGRSSGQWEHAETLAGHSSQAFAAAARRHKIWLHAGSLPERSEEPGRSYNTTLLFDRQGNLAASYRKIHLFDVDIATGSHRESATICPGNQVVVAPVEDQRLGLTICYDLRFPELFRTLALAGATIIAVPAAFTLYTGRDHWEVLLRARAIENQCFIVAAAQWGEHPPGQLCYGRSMIINPWGTVIAQAADGEGIVVADLDFESLRQVRANLPSLANRRPEIYLA